MRGVDLLTNAQLSNTLFDLLLFAEQCFARYLQQVASVVSKFLYHAHLQIPRRLEVGMFASASAVPATAVLDPAKNLKDRLWVRRMIVYQEQRRGLVCGSQVFGAHRHVMFACCCHGRVLCKLLRQLGEESLRPICDSLAAKVT
jgi:hypothetical protein